MLKVMNKALFIIIKNNALLKR